MHLAAGCAAQEYNQRKNRKGAFWEDRYHATAIQSKEHLLRCMLYIDFNMVRAGVVLKPDMWEYCGYYDIIKNNTNTILDKNCIATSTGYDNWEHFKSEYVKLVQSAIQYPVFQKDDKWTKSIAVGDEEFVAAIKNKLGIRVKKRAIIKSELSETCILKEPTPGYYDHQCVYHDPINGSNSLFWNPEDEIFYYKNVVTH
jgi:putative transposase